jgi:transposase
MSVELFWFSEEQWSKIEPHLPRNQRGPERQDDRRILSAIMYVMKVGCRWKDCPADYGPHKTIYNRFARWSERGVWQKIFERWREEPLRRLIGSPSTAAMSKSIAARRAETYGPPRRQAA